MQTDVVLFARHRILVLEAKFYRHSGYLYQLLAYLQNLATAEGAAAAGAGRSPRPVVGALVYPMVQERFDVRCELLGHRVWIRSVDLSREWRGVHEEVLGVVE